MTNNKIQTRTKNKLDTPRPANQANTQEGALEKVILQGDLSGLTNVERVIYNNKLCESLGINPLTKPIDYIRQGNRLSAFVNSQGMSQLRKLHRVSTTITDRSFLDKDTYQVIALASTAAGRSEESSAIICLVGKNGKSLTGQDRANKMMATETKAKRRASLGLLGLPLLENNSEGKIETSTTYDPPEDSIPHEYRHNPANIKEITAEKSSAEPTIKKKIAQAYNQHGWTTDAWKKMLKDWFQVDKTADCNDTSALLAIATNQQERDKYVDGEPVVAEAIIDDTNGWMLTEEKASELQNLWRSNNWTPSALKECLFSYFGFSSMAEIKNMDEDQFDSLKSLLTKPQTKKEFGIMQ